MKENLFINQMKIYRGSGEGEIKGRRRGKKVGYKTREEIWPETKDLS